MPTPEFVLRLREKIGHDQLWLPGVSVVVVDDAGRILLGRRSDTGRWSIIDGIPEPGEQPAAAAARECEEEAGVRPEILAVVAVEDARFYSHPGFDLEAIARATLVNLQSGEIEEGASTITQQLVKNLFLSPEQSMGRKVEELALAIDFECRYSKNEILALYLNTIYFGSGYYGIYDAAHGYFGKEPSQLSLPEAAMLAGLPNAPSLYSPYESFLMAKKRQFIVLDAMVRTGYIDERTATEAKIEPLYLAH